MGFRCMLMALICLTSQATAAERNIVLFVADDLSPDAGCYGNDVIQTPNMDDLARDGTLFTHAFATTASCSASRSVILSGLHNHSNGQYGHVHNYHKFCSHTWVESLPTLLKRREYRTVRIGKYHVAPEAVYPFDVYLKVNERDPVAMAERCREVLGEDTDKPFFLLFATADPHRGGGFAHEIPGRPNRFGNPLPQSANGRAPTSYRPEDVAVPAFLPDTPETRAELAQYYQSVSRVDRGLGRLIELLKETGRWDDTLLLFTSDHGMAFAGAKTTVYEPGLQIPMIVRNPYQQKRAVRNGGMVSLLDVTPTLIDFAGGLKTETGAIADIVGKKWEWHTYSDNEKVRGDSETGEMRWLPYTFHGRSLLPILGEQDPAGWDVVTASHTFHEIQMYYPMRVYRDRKYKLIWNIAYQLPFPFASDLLNSPTWQAAIKKGPGAAYGIRSVQEFVHRPMFELFDMNKDPAESRNLAADPDYSDVLREYQRNLKDFQMNTGDPWALKWTYD